MIEHDSECLNKKDKIGRSVGYYFKLAENVAGNSDYQTYDSDIENVLILMNQAYFSERIFIIFQTLREFSYANIFIPAELIFLICLPLINSTLIQDEPMEKIEQFGLSLQHYSPYKDSINYFCKCFNLREPSDLEIALDNILLVFINLIDKPVQSSFLLVLFDQIVLKHNNERRSYSSNHMNYKKPEFHIEYIYLCRKKHLIQNWRDLELQFREYFKPSLNCAFHYLMGNQQYSDIVTLFNELMKNIIFDRADKYHFAYLLGSKIDLLIKQERFYHHLTAEFFSNFNQLKNLKNFWEKEELQRISKNIDKLYSQYCKKFGPFFKPEPLPESELSENIQNSTFEKK